MDHPKHLIQDIQEGRMVVLMDDQDRENEGDLVVAASHATVSIVNFMLHHARGLLCLTITQKQADRLELPLMKHPLSEQKRLPQQTYFTMSVDASSGITSGASVPDRVHTMKVVADLHSQPKDIIIPGHVFPIIARDGGVLERAGHTEGSIDLVRLAGLNPAAVICEILRKDGEMARPQDLKIFASEHHLKIGCIADLISYCSDCS